MASCPWIGTGIFTLPGSAGSGTFGIVPARATAGEVSLIDATALFNGTLVYVESFRDMFIYDAASELVADGVLVLAPEVGPGRWIRRIDGDESWRRQASWFIDPSGNDENDGSSDTTALRTFAELRRRLGPGRQNLTPPDGTDVIEITLMNDLTADDPIELDVLLPAGKLVRFTGNATSEGNPDVTNVLDLDTTTPSLTQIEAPGFDFTGHVGKRLRVVTPDGDDVYAWILAATEPGLATLSAPAVLPPDVAFPEIVTIGKTAAGYTYTIEELSRARIGSVAGRWVSPGNPPATASVMIRDLHIGGDNLLENLDLATGLYQTSVVGCHLENLLIADSRFELSGCRLSSMGIEGGSPGLHACAAMPIDARGVALTNTDLTLDTQCTWYGTPLLLQHVTARIGGGTPSLSVFEVGSGVDGIQIDAATCVTIDQLVWGLVGTGYGWRVDAGGGVFYSASTKPTVHGVDGDEKDAIVGGEAKTYADIPYFNPSNGAAFVEK